MLAQNIDNLYDLGELYEVMFITVKQEGEDSKTIENIYLWIEYFRVYQKLPMTSRTPQEK